MAEQADCIVPIPLHWRRRLWRRYNQAAELARGLSAAAHRPFRPDLLHRIRATPPLTEHSRTEREHALANSMIVPAHKAVKDQRILLVDDVLTTGATMRAATDALKSAGAAEVNVLVLARVAQGNTQAL